MEAKLWNTLRFELERLWHAPPEESEERRAKIQSVAEALLAEPPESDGLEGRVLRRLLEELVEALADDRLPASFAELQRALERAAREHRKPRAAQPSGPASERAAAEALVAARELVAGRSLLVIGGIPRPDHRENLRRELGASEVLWPESSEGNPRLDPLEPFIARADVCAVVLLIRWIRHAMNEVARLCERHGKPLVRAPGGYNVNRIAQLLVESSKRRREG